MPKPHHVLVVLCAAAAGARAQAAEVVDLLAGRYADLRVGVYQPKVGPEVRCLRSDDDAAEFCAAAWGERNQELFVDFAREQILVFAWGALRFAERKEGPGIDLLLERATIRDGTLHATVRTVLGPGPGMDIDANEPGRTWYPSLFVRTPRTERVVVDLIGARRHDGRPDFRTVTEQDLVVRIGPDACPSREQITFAPRRATAAAAGPEVVLTAHDGATVLEVAWGELGSGSYPFALVGALVDGGTARVTVRAENRAIIFYSGPGVHHPGLALRLPPVDAVHLQVERSGDPLPAGRADFEPFTAGTLTVTVDRSLVRPAR
jgi:hypothetical protein